MCRRRSLRALRARARVRVCVCIYEYKYVYVCVCRGRSPRTASTLCVHIYMYMYTMYWHCIHTYMYMYMCIIDLHADWYRDMIHLHTYLCSDVREYDAFTYIYMWQYSRVWWYSRIWYIYIHTYVAILASMIYSRMTCSLCARARAWKERTNHVVTWRKSGLLSINSRHWRTQICSDIRGFHTASTL